MIRKYHNHKPQTTPWHREEEPLKPRPHEIVRLQNYRFVMNLGEDYLGPVFRIINDQSLRLFVKMHSMVVCDKKNSERSYDPSDEFSIFIAKGEGLSLRTCTYLCVQFQ